MTDAVVMTLSLLRGDDYSKTWSLTDLLTGASLVNTGDTFELAIKQSGGASSNLLLVNGAPSGGGSVINAINTATGAMQVIIRAVDLALIPGDPMAQLSLAFHFAQISSGLRTTRGYGPCIIQPAA